MGNACKAPEIAALDIEEGRLELSGDGYGGNVVRFLRREVDLRIWA